MLTSCRVTPYEGDEGFLVVWSSPDNVSQAATVCEVLSREGYRIWFFNQVAIDAQLINEKLSACCGLVALYSEQSMAKHDFRKVVTVAVLQEKQIAAVLLGDARLSCGLELQLDGSPRITYEEGMMFGQDFQKRFAMAKGAGNPSIIVEWRKPDEDHKAAQHLSLSKKEWEVSVMDEEYEKELLEKLQKTLLNSDSKEPQIGVVQIVSHSTDKINPNGGEKADPSVPHDDANQKDGSGNEQRNRNIMEIVKTILLDDNSIRKDTTTVLLDNFLPKLVLLDTGKLHHCRAGETSIGRAESCDVQLADTSVSMLHAKIKSTFTYHAAVNGIEDCGSSNGTWVNGKRLGKGESVAVSEDTVELRCGPQVGCLVAFGTASSLLMQGVTIAWLRCIETTEIRFLLDDQLLLGRKYGWANQSMDELHISWEHASLNRTEAGFSIVDTNSSNGVYHNGRRIPVGEAALLSDGDEIKLGLRHFVISIRKLV